MKKMPKKFRCTPRSAIFLASIKYATAIHTEKKNYSDPNKRRSYWVKSSWKTAEDLRAVASDLKNIVRTEHEDSMSWRAKADDEVAWSWKNNDLNVLQADLNATNEKSVIARIVKKGPANSGAKKPVRSNSI